MTEEAWGQPSGLSVPGTFVRGYCLANVDVLLVGSGYLLIRRQTLLAAPTPRLLSDAAPAVQDSYLLSQIHTYAAIYH